MLIGIVIYVLLKRRIKQVEEFDRRKRYEQRAMSNIEIEEVYNKRVNFTLVDKDDKEFSAKDIAKQTTKNEYYVLWYDAKMKNYLTFLEYVQKKNMVQAKINAILVVDKKEMLANVEKIKAESSNE